MHKSAPKLGLTVGEKLTDKILLHIHVLVEKAGQLFLIDILSVAHHRELEETGHGRRQGVLYFIALLDIHQHRPGGELIQHLPGLRLAHLPDRSCFRCSKGFNRKG